MTDSARRPEVVDAVYSALIEMNPAKLTALEKTGIRITEAERAAAEDLYMASMLASLSHRERRLAALQLLAGGREIFGPPSWADLFDGLSPERAEQLRDLYDALPEGAQAEYDRRYGPPMDSG